MEAVTVRVPASTSNLGPGFDCLGIALRLYNHVTLTRKGTHHLDPMVSAAAKSFFAATKRKRFGFDCAIKGNVPPARGLGASVTVRLGVLHGLNELCGRPLDRHKLFELCAKLEGHPDNAAPAEFGGFNVMRDGVRQKFKVNSSLQFILLIPEFEIATASARKILPTKIDRINAVQSCANACAITAAFVSRDYEKLRGGFGDFLHQPFRKKLIPFFDKVVAAAEKAGALGAFLSGSGSTIAALALQDRHKIAKAMLAACKTKARVLITTADNHGTQIK
ncbi:MAG: homoserine kinase [Verrucomicrobiota bacterium]